MFTFESSKALASIAIDVICTNGSILTRAWRTFVDIYFTEGWKCIKYKNISFYKKEKKKQTQNKTKPRC